MYFGKNVPKIFNIVSVSFGCQSKCKFVSVIHSSFSVQLVAAIVFLSFGIISSFLCLVVDGVFILLNIVSTLTVNNFA